MSDNPDIDNREMSLTDALSKTVAMDAGTLISCVPGKLAYFEMEGFVPGADSLDDKRWCIAENKRKDLSVAQVLGWINQTHLETVGILHWLKVLTDYIPELAELQDHVSLLFCT